jgi:sulfatase maturation enzyme AslB (radical SAM superfamily)
MIAHERFDICLSFVTNGTTFNESLINKLKRFARVGIELSIETVTEHNTYVRQGTDTKLVLANIQKYQQYCNRSSITLTIRPAISALTVGYYYTLLDYCLEHQLIIKSLLVTAPAYLDIKVLPDSVKSQYKDRYQKILEQVSEVDINVDYNESDPNNYRQSIKMQILQVLVMLNQPSDQNLLKELVEICRRWDNEFGYDAVKLYPELAEVFLQYGY